MSDATDALAEAQADCITQHGVSFTVEGVAGTKTCIASAVVTGAELQIHGMEQARGCVIHFPTATWTPVIGKRVTVHGIVFVVNSYQTETGAYNVTLVESHT